MLHVSQKARRVAGSGLLSAVLAAIATAGLAASPAGASVSPPAGAQVSAYGWGLNDSGQLGNGTFDGNATPLPVSGLNNVRQVAEGQLSSAALLADGTVDTWGYDGQGELGDGSTAQVYRLKPAPVPGLTGIVQIAAGAGQVLALKSDGTVWAWGSNFYRQLGDGTQTDRPTPFQIPGLTGISQVSANFYDSMAVRSDGSVWAWGHNGFGELGDGTTTNRATPERLPGLSSVVQVSAGLEHGLAVKSDGTVWSWGNDASGQLGVGTTTNHASPVQVPGLTGVTQVAAGLSHSLAVAGPDNSVWAWGDDGDSALGDGATAQQDKPVHIGLSGVTQIAAGAHQSAAVSSSGSLFIWGQALFSSVTGPTTVPTLFPLPSAVGGATPAIQVSLGADNGLAVGISSTTVPSVLNLTRSQATAAIQAAGLTVGQVGNETDDSCNHLGKVMDQSPQGGDQAAVGSAVNFSIGQAPTNIACP